jgi:cytochrome oxidase assembly protein ShyY1
VSAASGIAVPAALTAAGLVVLIGLGTWQLERKVWKQKVIAALAERVGAPPVALPPPEEWGALSADNSEFLRVRFRVDFRGEDALVYTGGSTLRDDVKAPGYFVFTAARLPGGQSVVVNRGYAKERSVPKPAGPAEIVGYLRWPEPSPWFVTDYDAGSNVWHVRNHLLMAVRYGWERPAPFYVEQEAPVPPDGVPHPAKLHPNLPDNHLQYALTWYALALALFCVFAIWALDRWRRRGAESGIPS